MVKEDKFFQKKMSTFLIFEKVQKNWVLITNFDFIIPIFLQPNVADLRFYMNYEKNNLKIEISSFTEAGCKDKRIRKFDVVARTQFFWIEKSEKEI